MSASQEDSILDLGTSEKVVGIDWDAYATQYDLMAKFNPSYHENISLLRSSLPNWNIPSEGTICDLGAGTGNYIAALSRILPDAEYYHVDFDEVMNEIARDKYRKIGLESVHFLEDYIQRIDFPDDKFDLIICVNALYAMSPQMAVLRKIHRWLKPSGRLFLIDYGRRTRMMDWGWYMLKSLIRDHGIAECARFFLNSAEVVRQNRQGSKHQLNGGYWLHTTNEFGDTLAKAGFVIDDLRLCYRDYCDLAVCSLPINNPPSPEFPPEPPE